MRQANPALDMNPSQKGPALAAALGAACLLLLIAAPAQALDPASSQQLSPAASDTSSRASDAAPLKGESEAREGTSTPDEQLAPKLADLNRQVAEMQRFNTLLRDRIDILSHRIEQLEAENQAQSDHIASLSALQNRDGKTEPAPMGDLAQNQNKSSDPLAPQTQSPQASPAPDDQDQSEEKSPSDVEKLLDLGEAMMRRFFGVVRGFRQDFEDNRV